MRSNIIPQLICKECLRVLRKQSDLIVGTGLQYTRSFASTSRRRCRSREDLPKNVPSTAYTQLSDRALLAVHGPDAAHFLQGITTANIAVLPPSQNARTGIPAAFLNAQGRVMFDVFIYPVKESKLYIENFVPESTIKKHGSDAPAYLIDVDSSRSKALQTWLKRYKLRARLDLIPLEQGAGIVWASWDSKGENEPTNWLPQPLLEKAIFANDVRAPGLGYRLVLPYSASSSTLLQQSQVEKPEVASDYYKLRRYLLGVPSGPQEIIPETSLPAESNLDFMGAIDFRKGCYVGQELTIRTRHTGVVRKRILPVQIRSTAFDLTREVAESPAYDPAQSDIANAVAPGADIRTSGTNRKSRSAGGFRAGIGNIGLALCRIEMMTDLRVMIQPEIPVSESNSEPTQSRSPKTEFTVKNIDDQDMYIKAFVPAWIRAGVEQTQRKEERYMV